MTNEQAQVAEQAASQAEAAKTEATTAATSQAETATEKMYPESEVKKLRQEAAGYRTKLKEIEDANKTEAEKLAERAKRADELEPENAALRASVSALVDDLKKDLPAQILNLLPEGTPATQLDWLRKAKTAATELKGSAELPNSGGRNPGAAGEAGKKVAEEAIFKRLQGEVPALRGRVLRDTN
jgi:hypothetical protein